VGLAWCSPKDRFSRKKGRTLAIERLYDDPIIVEVLFSPLRTQEDLIAALCTRKEIDQVAIVAPNQKNKVPSWAQKWFRWHCRAKRVS
jgi:hypothetical protein